MIIQTKEQLEFRRKLKMWYGRIGHKPLALKLITGIRIQSGYICLELVDDDGDEAEWAINLDELVKEHAVFIQYSHPEDAEESKAEMIHALKRALKQIKLQQSDYISAPQN